MKLPIFSLLTLSAYSLCAQPPTPVVHPPVYNHPNTTPPNSYQPPAPNSPNPYDPYESRTGPCSQSLTPFGETTPPPPGVCKRSGNYTLSPEFTQARSAAMHFLNIVDNQVYAGAWLDAGGILHDTVPQDIWVAGMRAIRTHLGRVRSRSFNSVTKVQALPGGLIGEFVIIRYDTSFTFESRAAEIITLMLHPPIGIWKVICYNVKP